MFFFIIQQKTNIIVRRSQNKGLKGIGGESGEEGKPARTLALSWAMIFMRSASMLPSFFSDSSTSSGRTTFEDDPIAFHLLHPQITNRKAPTLKFPDQGASISRGGITLSAVAFAGDPKGQRRGLGFDFSPLVITEKREKRREERRARDLSRVPVF